LGGLYQIKEGSISYNDIPFGNLNPIKLRSVIGDCLMDEQLFEGTLLENISMGREKANFENVVWAVKQLGLDSFVKSLSEGYNTVIYPQGKKFPKGIVERLILARSIADKPKLLIISDTFSAIDREEKERIFKFLTEDEAPWTLVVSTNDLSLSKFIKRQVVVENGKLNDIKV
jgi:ABC-type bacteriocin/lantibiotic exporter with double-glycine peptidase domain